MSIYITESAAENAIVQEGTFYPEDQRPLTSALFNNNRTLNLINLGKGASLKIGADNNKEAVRLLHLALFTVVPEMPGVSDAAKTNALNLKNTNSFGYQFTNLTEWLVRYFQENTAELSAIADGKVGRKTIKELDNSLNRIGGYDEINGGTIINYGLAEYVNKDTVVYTTYAGVDYVPLYNKPLPNIENSILRLKKDDIVHVLRKHPEETAPGWYQVIVLSASMDIQDADGQEELRNAYGKNEGIVGHIEAAYVWDYWEEVDDEQKAPMPDIYSKLYKIPARPVGQTEIQFSNEQLISIIQETYYDEVRILPRNSDGEIFEPVDPNDIVTFPARDEILEDDIQNGVPFFRFCLNLLIYANNPKSGEAGIQRSIYPDPASGKEFFDQDIVDAAYTSLEQLYQSDTNPTELYNHFMSVIMESDVNGEYDYIKSDNPVNEKIRVLLKDTGNYYMWIPSRQCAESLWRVVNFVYTDELTLDDPITQLAEHAIEALFPARSLGYRGRVEIGATYGFLAGDLVGDVSMWRQDTEHPNAHILKISAYGQLKVGGDAGYGGGFGKWMGSGKKKRKGIGVALGLSAQAGVDLNALIEFEIPVTGRDPMSRGLSAMMYSAIGFLLPFTAPFAFYRAIENLDLDFWNYMTRLKVYAGVYGEVGGQAQGTFKYGNTEDIPNWQNATVNSNFLNPIKIPALFSGAAASAGLSVGAELGLGFDIEVKYYTGSNYLLCMRNDGTRIPLEVKLFAFGEASVHAEFFTALTKGLFGIPILPGFFLNPGLGIKVGIVYNISEEVVDNNTADFDFSFGKMIKNGKKILSLYNFLGDLDRYEEVGYEAAYNFNFDGLIAIVESELTTLTPSDLSTGNYRTSNYEFGTSLNEILEQLEDVEFKKRMGLGWARRKYRMMKKAQSIVRDRWHDEQRKFINGGKRWNRSGSLTIQSYIDLDYSVKGEDYIKAIKAIAIMVRVGVAILNGSNVEDCATLDNVLAEFNDERKELDARIAYANDLYNDPEITNILSDNADTFVVLSKLINMTVVEIGNKTGWYRSQEDSFSTMDQGLKEMIFQLTLNYVLHWEDIRISLHTEAGYGFGIGGKIGLGGQLRGFLGIEAAAIVHSDFIKYDYVYNNYWHKYIVELLGIDPGLFQGGQVLSPASKANIVHALFDKQM